MVTWPEPFYMPHAPKAPAPAPVTGPRPEISVADLDDDEWFAFHALFGQVPAAPTEKQREWTQLRLGMSEKQIEEKTLAGIEKLRARGAIRSKGYDAQGYENLQVVAVFVRPVQRLSQASAADKKHIFGE